MTAAERRTFSGRCRLMGSGQLRSGARGLPQLRSGHSGDASWSPTCPASRRSVRQQLLLLSCAGHFPVWTEIIRPTRSVSSRSGNGMPGAFRRTRCGTSIARPRKRSWLRRSSSLGVVSRKYRARRSRGCWSSPATRCATIADRCTGLASCTRHSPPSRPLGPRIQPTRFTNDRCCCAPWRRWPPAIVSDPPRRFGTGWPRNRLRPSSDAPKPAFKMRLSRARGRLAGAVEERPARTVTEPSGSPA